MSEQKIKFNCSGCGVEFDLLLSRYRAAVKYGRKTFYHNRDCLNKTNKHRFDFTRGKKISHT